MLRLVIQVIRENQKIQFFCNEELFATIKFLNIIHKKLLLRKKNRIELGILCIGEIYLVFSKEVAHFSAYFIIFACSQRNNLPLKN